MKTSENTACADFGVCGGCVYQDIPYTEELSVKKALVAGLLQEEHIDINISPSPVQTGYRNKMEFAFGDEQKGGDMALGIRKRKSFYEVVTPTNCNIIDEDFRKIVIYTLQFFRDSCESFYHKRMRKGSLRHLVIRKAFFTGEIMVMLVTTSTLSTNLAPWADGLCALALEGTVVGILHAVNDGVSDVVKSEVMHQLYGRGYFFEELMGLRFKITPFSFFQTNSAAAQELYKTVCNYIGDVKEEVIFDLYCGTGTLAQIVSHRAKEVIGIELVPEAVDAAKENAALNGINNTHFVQGDVLAAIDELTTKPSIIIIDPPRGGIHPKAIGKIINFNAKTVVYVSCNPASFARDLQFFLEAGYKLKGMALHDMFPRTGHVESVALLCREEKTAQAFTNI